MKPSCAVQKSMGSILVPKFSGNLIGIALVYALCQLVLAKFLLIQPIVNKLKTTPTPNNNGSYGIKWGVRAPYFGGPYAILSVEIP